MSKEIRKHILYGGDVTLPSNLNYAKVLLDNFQVFKEEVALIDAVSDQRLKFNDLVQQIINVADSLTRIGVKKGDVVAICSENRFEFLITCYAIIYIGGVANFINKAYSTDELVHTLGISKPKYIFCSTDTYRKYKQVLTGMRFLKIFVFDNISDAKYVNSYEDLVNKNAVVNSVKPAKLTDGSETAIIIYSSGTTGMPKGVKWTHLALITATKQPLVSARKFIHLSIAPWTNTMGYIVTCDLLSKGKTVVSLATYNENVYYETIQKFKVGVLVAPPPLIVIMTKSTIINNYDMKSVEIINSGGAPLESKILTQIKKRLPKLKYILQTYGMSEATGAVSKESEMNNKPGSVGKILPGIIAKIVDVKTNKTLSSNHKGEVCIKGSALFGGYIGKNSNDDYDNDGFYKTGDIAYYDDDGYLYVVDRIKELIKYKGYQVGPTELESIILQHEGIKDAAVIGLPDEVAGELPMAFIVKQTGHKITEKEVIDFVNAKVSSWKKLRGGVRFIDQIPKNPSGKILRRQLRNLVLNTRSKL